MAQSNDLRGRTGLDAQSSSRLSFRSLEIFLAVAEEGGFTQAARKLGLTLAAISLAISRLEQRLGRKLFEGRRKQLTWEGRKFLCKIHEDVRRMQAVLRGVEEEWMG